MWRARDTEKQKVSEKQTDKESKRAREASSESKAPFVDSRLVPEVLDCLSPVRRNETPGEEAHCTCPDAGR